MNIVSCHVSVSTRYEDGWAGLESAGIIAKDPPQLMLPLIRRACVVCTGVGAGRCYHVDDSCLHSRISRFELSVRCERDVSSLRVELINDG